MRISLGLGDCSSGYPANGRRNIWPRIVSLWKAGRDFCFNGGSFAMVDPLSFLFNNATLVIEKEQYAHI